MTMISHTIHTAFRVNDDERWALNTMVAEKKSRQIIYQGQINGVQFTGNLLINISRDMFMWQFFFIDPSDYGHVTVHVIW